MTVTASPIDASFISSSTMGFETLGSYATPSGTQAQNILLDSSIRDWVVLPLLIIMIEAGLLRHYLGIILKSSTMKKSNHLEKRCKSVLSRASRLRTGAASYLSKSKLESRRKYWMDGGDKAYLKEEMIWMTEEEEEIRAEKERLAEEAAANGTHVEGEDDNDGLPDPMAMMGPLKGQMAFMVQNMVMMQGIGYFFSGYVLVKVPIPLTNGFKLMFQRGLDLSTLETSYVSSVSWYFLVMFGLRAFFKLVIDGNGNGQQVHSEGFMVQSDLGHVQSMGGPNAPKFDCHKALEAEIENLQLVKFKSTLDDADKRLLGPKYLNKKVSSKTSSTGNEPGYDIFGASATKSGGRGGGKKGGTKKVKTF